MSRVCCSLRTADVSPPSSPLKDVLRVEFLLAHRHWGTFGKLSSSSLIATEGRFASWVPPRLFCRSQAIVCCCFGSILCWSPYLVPLLHTQTVNCRVMKKRSSKLHPGTLTIILQAQHQNLKTLVQLFHVLIRVHRCHPLQQTTGNSFKA